MQHEQREFSLITRPKLKPDRREERAPKAISGDFTLEPLKPDTVVVARLDLPCCGLERHKAYKITGYKELPQVAGGYFKRYFYSINNKDYLILLDYIQVAGPVCKI